VQSQDSSSPEGKNLNLKLKHKSRGQFQPETLLRSKRLISVDFTNILCQAFMRSDPNNKKSVKSSVFFVLFGSVHVKAVRKMLLKSIPANAHVYTYIIFFCSRHPQCVTKLVSVAGTAYCSEEGFEKMEKASDMSQWSHKTRFKFISQFDIMAYPNKLM